MDSDGSRLVASTRGLRRGVTRVSLVYPLAGILEPQKEVDSRLVVRAVSKSIYRGRVPDPRLEVLELHSSGMVTIFTNFPAMYSR